jgi:HAMP domain-containing protein
MPFSGFQANAESPIKMTDDRFFRLIFSYTAQELSEQCYFNMRILTVLYELDGKSTLFEINEKLKLEPESLKHIIDYLSNLKIIAPAKKKIRIQALNFAKSNNGLTGKRERNFTLRMKFNIALIGIMLISELATFFISNDIFKNGAVKQAASNARLLLATIEASRTSTQTVIKPALYKELPDRFIVEGMSSSYVARSIFEKVKEKYPAYYFKHASQNPRNKLNLADEFENELLDKTFKPNPQVKEWQGFRTLRGKKDFVIMKPIVADESCMKCHSVPENAPRELIERYGNVAGFGMAVGDIIGALSISVPATEILSIARNNSLVLNMTVFLCFIILIIIVNLFFQQIVIKPIRRLSKIVYDISLGQSNTGVEASGSDEISDLARGFERMRISINLALSRIR